MPKFRIKVSDTVTYAREQVVTVKARDLEAACDKVLLDVDKFVDHNKWDEEQIDNTPYEAEKAEKADD